MSGRLLAILREALVDVPGELRLAIEAMVRHPAEIRSVRDLAERARVDRRTCTRWFERVRLPPPSAVLAAVRAVYAHHLLRNPGHTVEYVARTLGYAQVRAFANTIREIYGVSPSALRNEVSVDTGIAMLRDRYFRPYQPSQTDAAPPPRTRPTTHSA